MSATPLTLLPVIVQIKENWTDSWVTIPNVEPIAAGLTAAGIGQCSFRVRYGDIKYPAAGSFVSNTHTQINRQWIKVLRSPYDPGDILFQGRIEADTRVQLGPTSGIQTFTAFDGGQLLNKIEIATSIVNQGGTKETIDQLLGFDIHPNTRQLNANRSTSKIDGNYVFQLDGEYWKHEDAVEYLFGEFVNGADQPVWTFEGNILDSLGTVEFNDKTTALGMLQILLSSATGWSYVILPTVAGFLLRVFSLAVSEVTYGGITIIKNPNTVVVSNLVDPTLEIVMEESQVNQYSTLVVRGSPMVVCRSFKLADGELLKGWETENSDEDLMTEYEAADDIERRNDKFANLWCRFVVDLQTADKWTAANNPSIDEDGTVDDAVAAPIPQFSAAMDSLPFRSGNSYGSGLPDPHYDGEFLPPLLFVKDMVDEWREFKTLETGADLAVLSETIGVQIRTKLPHVFGSGDYGVLELDSEVYPTLNVDSAILTIAYQSPHRVQKTYTSGTPTNADGTFILDSNTVDLWYAAEGTVYGVHGEDSDFAGDLQTLTEAVTVKDDSDSLDRIMAGAIARYFTGRGKAAGSSKGLHAWHLDIGKVLITDDPDVESVLTSVSWTFENGYRTNFDSGFALP